MHTPREKSAVLLEEAAEDVRELYSGCLKAGHKPPVVFVVDMNDLYGRSFAENFIPPEKLDDARAIQDGGVRTGAIGTFLCPMSVRKADAILSRMNETGASLGDYVQPGCIVAVVVAFGAVTPFTVTASTD